MEAAVSKRDRRDQDHCGHEQAAVGEHPAGARGSILPARLAQERGAVPRVLPQHLRHVRLHAQLQGLLPADCC